MTTTSRPSGRLTAMICRMRLRRTPALGQSSASTVRLNASHGSVEQPDEQRDHQPADQLHQVEVQSGTGKATEGREKHPIAASKQQQDCYPNPWKEFLEGDSHEPQALRRLERAERRSQADIDREHAADPDDGAEDVQGEIDGSPERGSRFEALKRLS